MSFCSWGNEKFKDFFKAGKYVCVKCGHDLFSSNSKYEHSSPWPAFSETLRPDSLYKKPETAEVFKIHCGNCKHPLGHQFLGDGPKGKSRF